MLKWSVNEILYIRNDQATTEFSIIPMVAIAVMYVLIGLNLKRSAKLSRRRDNINNLYKTEDSLACRRLIKMLETQVRKRWKNLRDTYRIELKKNQRNPKIRKCGDINETKVGFLRLDEFSVRYIHTRTS